MITPILAEHLVVAAFGLVVAYSVFIGRHKMHATTFDTEARVGMYWANSIVLWIAAAAVCGVWFLADRSFLDLGLTLQHASLGITLLLTAFFIAWFVGEGWHEISTPARRAASLARARRGAPFLPTTSREYAHYSVAACTAGITEEIIARGFLIQYVSAFTGTSTAGMVAAVTIPALGFGVAHLYQGWWAVSRIVLLAGIFGAIFVVSGSLLIPIILHIAVDLVSGWMPMRIAGPGWADEASEAGKTGEATAA